MKRIIIEVIDPKDQRYETCGDWYYVHGEDENLIIRVSDTKDWRYNALVAIHELVEALACKDMAIPEEIVTQFDVEFEAKRLAGDNSEPGDSPDAPYQKQHFFATNIERQVAAELRVDWRHYEEVLSSL